MSVSNDNSNNYSNTCVVCYKNVEYYSIGMCEHPVCFECSTRMRVLCQQNECPICRQDLPKVVFTKEIKAFRFLKKGNLLDIKYNIYFDNAEIQNKFLILLAHTCTICANQVFGSFTNLQDHMKRKHDLHYCQLCADNLKIFSYERRCYTRAELSKHQSKGDQDDKSHKGHPLCEFCDQRYMDVDELYRHLRRDHLFCHFCDADGFHQYYNSYDYLRKHFQTEHHLCEEGSCISEPLTSVFRTDIDLRAHKAKKHGKQLGKAAAKQARTLELEFTLAPRGDLRGRRGPPGATRGSRDHGGYHQPHQQLEVEPAIEKPVFTRQPLVDVQSTQEFPRLGNVESSPCPAPGPGQSKTRGNLTICSTLRKGNYDENFPALGPESAAAPPSLPKSFNVSVSSTNKAARSTFAKPATTAAPDLSIHVNRRPNGMVMTRLSGSSSLRIKPGPSRDSDFPALGQGSTGSAADPSTRTWTKITCVKPTTTQVKKVAPAPLTTSPPPLRSGQDYPSLAKPTKGQGKGKETTAPNGSPSPWLQVHTTDSSDKFATITADATKGKAKKKKMKQQQQQQQQQQHNSLTNNESTSHVHDVNRKAEQRSPSKDTEQESSTVAPVTIPRKRSELKIENLNTKNNNLSTKVKTSDSTRANNFPVLSRSGNRPPGLGSPPPGFGGSTTATTPATPPPGFLSRLNGLTFTNSSGENYTIVPDETDQPHRCYTYQQPDNFQRRNQSLMAKFNDCLGPDDGEDFKAFRYLSRLYRSGIYNAATYYKQCRTVMGVGSFKRLFPELLALLPDIDKQRELFEVHKNEASADDVFMADLIECPKCGQILHKVDLHSHATSHSIENHFPVLGKNSPASNHVLPKN
ncbi:PREDICTED: zinc finger protein 598 [Ceratosolen solmsi marchali]|uniref:RING-type E3 ubiquitin transferase n=1 Tax=Ceratosolen solmsi marchali TaxID=326594 RepID=A0AAJ7DZA7_9HYME|nr:PREDICTED: zinc finger protein 598 [Ceratosolen solmsi marchali]